MKISTLFCNAVAAAFLVIDVHSEASPTTCSDGLTGTRCDEKDFCYYYPCQHDGTCVNKPPRPSQPWQGKYGRTCHCPDAYIGKSCEFIMATKSHTEKGTRRLGEGGSSGKGTKGPGKGGSSGKGTKSPGKGGSSGKSTKSPGKGGSGTGGSDKGAKRPRKGGSGLDSCIKMGHKCHLDTECCRSSWCRVGEHGHRVCVWD